MHPPRRQPPADPLRRRKVADDEDAWPAATYLLPEVRAAFRAQRLPDFPDAARAHPLTQRAWLRHVDASLRERRAHFELWEEDAWLAAQVRTALRQLQADVPPPPPPAARRLDDEEEEGDLLACRIQ